MFTLVAAPVLAKIVPDLKSSGRNVTGVFHVAPTEAQMRAMASYRPFRTVGILYTPSESNSVVVVDEVRAVAARMGFKVVAMPFALEAGQASRCLKGPPNWCASSRQQGCDWLYLPPDSFLGTWRRR